MRAVHEGDLDMFTALTMFLWSHGKEDFSSLSDTYKSIFAYTFLFSSIMSILCDVGLVMLLLK